MVLQTTTVDGTSAGLRLDLFLTQCFARQIEEWGLSRTAVQRLIAAGEITLNGERVKPGTRVKPDDRIVIRKLPTRESKLAPEALGLLILYEDEDFVVINKAPGIVVHPAGGHAKGTLVNALLYHCPDIRGIGGEQRPGIVHRLDKDTSGVMIVAKNDRSFQQLARQFRDRKVHKEYLALVWGKFPVARGIIDRPIGRHRADRKKMSSIRSLAKRREAVTEWSREGEFFIGTEGKRAIWVSLLRLTPRTGRTHQIRVHLADLGCPLVGDKVYGRKHQSALGKTKETASLVAFPRQALHAQKLGIVHPRSGVPMEFASPVWPDMAQLLDSLGARSVE